MCGVINVELNAFFKRIFRKSVKEIEIPLYISSKVFKILFLMRKSEGFTFKFTVNFYSCLRGFYKK